MSIYQWIFLALVWVVVVAGVMGLSVLMRRVCSFCSPRRWKMNCVGRKQGSKARCVSCGACGRWSIAGVLGTQASGLLLYTTM